MTAHSAIASRKTRNARNIKDGGNSLRRKSGLTKAFEGRGFIRSDWNKWTYTWTGNFPVFKVGPGTVINNDGSPRQGLVARYVPADKEILFPYGTSPAEIAGRLDDEILAIMRHDVDIDTPPLVGEQEIGPEIPF